MNEVEIVLASSSASRRAMLESAGLFFTTTIPNVDEEMIRASLAQKGLDAAVIAEALAEAKALAVSQRHPAALTIGADQILLCEGRIFTKALDEVEARETLHLLRGRRHELITAAVLAKGEEVVWRHRETAELQIRPFSAAFLDSYMTAEMPEILGSVGCYRVEARGSQLFERIVGDHFCIRGLPLIPLLEALRGFGALPA